MVLEQLVVMQYAKKIKYESLIIPHMIDKIYLKIIQGVICRI